MSSTYWLMSPATVFPGGLASISLIITAGTTVTETVSVSVSGPPEPVLPRSLVRIVRPAVPANEAVGVNFMPFIAALMFVIVPVKVMEVSAVPSPPRNVRPVSPPSVMVPLAAVNVTCTGLVPASASAMEIALPLAAEKTCEVPWTIVWVPGTVLTGAVFTELTAIVLLAVALLNAELPPLVDVSTMEPATPEV